MVNDMGKKRRQIILEFNLSSDARKRKRKDMNWMRLFVTSLICTEADLQLLFVAMNIVTTATPDKTVLLRARRHKRAEVNELKSISEKRGFPASSKLPMATQAELQDDLALMGVSFSWRWTISGSFLTGSYSRLLINLLYR